MDWRLREDKETETGFDSMMEGAIILCAGKTDIAIPSLNGAGTPTPWRAPPISALEESPARAWS